MEIIGWISSAILAVTIIHQVYTQWRDEESAGVSLGLFVGQCAANIGFIVYALDKPDWVFVFTNALLLLTNLIGFFLTQKQQKQEEAAA
ncbi:MAG: hypothetical protein ACO1RX_14285 [Candidatus Sericytochromatia bacterium]